MKKVIRLLVVSLLLLVTINNVHGEEYYYQVSVYAGMHGVFNNSDAIVIDNSMTNSTPTIVVNEDRTKITITGLKANDLIGIVKNNITVNDVKYYVKGIKTGGRDNENAYIYNWYNITKDNNFVVAYGIPGNQVAYTTYYVDQEGNELREPETYYGTIGEYTIAGYKYIDGYLPQAYNLGQTLNENPQENNYTFVYRVIPGLVAENGSTSVIDGSTTTVTNDDNANDTDTDTSTGNNQTTTTTDNQSSGANESGEEQATTDSSQVEEFIDLDDQQTPLSEGNDDTTNMTTNNLLLYGGIGGLLLIIVAIIVVITTKRVKNDK